MYTACSVNIMMWLFQGVYENIKGDGITKGVWVETKGCLKCLDKEFKIYSIIWIIIMGVRSMIWQ